MHHPNERAHAQFWVGSATRDHVLIGVEGGFCQLSHGKAEPLRKMNRGDWIIYYSGRESWDTNTPCQRFTAIGEVTGDDVYQVHLPDGFHPFRRQVRFCEAGEADIRSLLPALTFIRSKQFWGLPFRRGYFEISEADFQRIAEPMLHQPFKAPIQCSKSKGKSHDRTD
ncbi:MAG TPA: EVE domain-containing protein [Thermoanaerobaculia bacterium]|nr:EVE domain-containing protein [Thermoanaerobaculia bacterium]